jgi:hypothetical protein
VDGGGTEVRGAVTGLGLASQGIFIAGLHHTRGP